MHFFQTFVIFDELFVPSKHGSSRGAASGGLDFSKMTPSHVLAPFRTILYLSSRGLAGVLPPAGQTFEKWHLLEYFVNFGDFLCLSRMGLAGVLPPAGQIFEELHFLENFVTLAKSFVPSKQGSSRAAASGGSDF